MEEQGQKTPAENAAVDPVEAPPAPAAPAEVVPVAHAAPAPTEVTPAAASAPQPAVAPSACGGVGPAQVDGQLVYALGTLGYDLGSEARRDSFAQAMGEGQLPEDPAAFRDHLNQYPYAATGMIWTLELDGTPIYAIMPAGPFAETAHQHLREFFSEQLDEGVQRVVVPGVAAGRVQLRSGHEVPAVIPELRGMGNWSTAALIEAVLGEAPTDPDELAEYEEKVGDIGNFLERVYHELRNLGTDAADRAMNHAATNAFQVAQVFAGALKDKQELDRIEVERSPVSRPDSDCWDVKLTFFHPTERQAKARKVHRFTIDVSDVVPVTVGSVRSWSVY